MFENEVLKTFRKWKRLLEIVSKFVKLPEEVSGYKLEPGFFFYGAPIVLLIISDGSQKKLRLNRDKSKYIRMIWR